MIIPVGGHCPRRNRALGEERWGPSFGHSSLRGKAAQEVSPRLSPETGEGSTMWSGGVRRWELQARGGKVLDESEDLKGHWGTFHPPQRPSCRKWGVPMKCRGRLLAYSSIWPWKQWFRLPWGFPGTPSVWLAGLSSSHPGQMGAEGLAFSFSFFPSTS